MAGFLVPDTYVVVAPSLNDLLIASIIWGFTLATGVFSGTKAFKQTWATWRRSRRLHAYAYMIWAEWVVSMVIGVLSWVFIRGLIEPSFWIYFAFLCLWVVQIQCICGIIINRIALLMVDKRDAAKIRWVTAVILGLINISVFVVWIPARLQISPIWVHVNEIYDRIEKGLFLIIDACLHLYFIYLLRVKLIANGLEKYVPLFRFNLMMVAVSMSLDIILIGSMSIGNGFIYVQFHPLVYMLKLHIEMNISSLIVKVVRATGDNSSYARGTELQSKLNNRSGAATTSNNNFSGNRTHVEAEAADEAPQRFPQGITKIVQTRVTVSPRNRDDLVDDDDGSSHSSTRQLKHNSQAYREQFV
ncbi:hypothetical protein B0J13DRAFT_652521 [Dactylonectria estremocensis]|uniref:Uncharacterized protein n=1 Tax=Dactylonectria estremocensis TaxID=1079267 RepID=A0A9P9I9H4_9HYPO|nr:hypothetical protein B0J13DRAFT_461146 [Dactylonectria estremocensis]KAH7118117.1 hypothetical protein B0J13DRAFT_652521 [Dactylonectria estremocensis]